jgi:outer membrane protein assembly factor BamB
MNTHFLSTMLRRSAALLLIVSVAGSLLGCAGNSATKPAELVPNPALIGVKTAWTAKVGAINFPLDLRLVGSQLFVADSQGAVLALDPATGQEFWRTNLAQDLSAGVGSDGRYAAVVGTDNQLIVLESGKELWRQPLGAVTLTSPLVAGARVFTLSADRTLSAFDAATGRKLWQQQRSGDALVLAQSGVLMAVGNTLVAGLSGRLVGVSPLNGAIRWEVPVAVSRGTNDVERLVDLVAGVSRLDENLCVRAFQSAVACVDAGKGRLLWSKNASGATGLHGNATHIFGTESDGKLLAWRRADGERTWVSQNFSFRKLSTPLLAGNTLIVADGFGWVHFLSPEDGSTLHRVSTDGSAIKVAPVLSGQNVVVVTERGSIYAFRRE